MIAPTRIIQNIETIPALWTFLSRYPLAASGGPEALGKCLFVMRYLNRLPPAFEVEAAVEGLRLDSGEVLA